MKWSTRGVGTRGFRALTAKERQTLWASRPQWWSVSDGCLSIVIHPLLGMLGSLLVVVLSLRFFSSHFLEENIPPHLLFTTLAAGFSLGLFTFFWPLLERGVICLDLQRNKVNVFSFDILGAAEICVFDDAQSSFQDDSVGWLMGYLLDIGGGRLLHVCIDEVEDFVETGQFPSSRIEYARVPLSRRFLGIHCSGERIQVTGTIRCLALSWGFDAECGEVIFGTLVDVEADFNRRMSAEMEGVRHS